MNHKIVLPAISLLALLLTGNHNAEAVVLRDWYVATNGVDAPEGGTREAPLKTIVYALSAAAAGDVINLRQGTYHETEMVRLRKPHTTLQALPGERATIVAPVDDENNFSSCVWLNADIADIVLRRLDLSGGYDGRPTSPFEPGTLTDWSSHIQGESHSFERDPQFAEAAHEDFRLRAASPAIDAGVILPEMVNDGDLLGAPRIFGGQPDLGAIEAVLWARKIELVPAENRIVVRWEAPPGALCQVEFSPPLNPPAWVKLGEPVTADLESVFTLDPRPVDRSRIYRLKWQR